MATTVSNLSHALNQGGVLNINLYTWFHGVFPDTLMKEIGLTDLFLLGAKSYIENLKYSIKLVRAYLPRVY